MKPTIEEKIKIAQCIKKRTGVLLGLHWIGEVITEWEKIREVK